MKRIIHMGIPCLACGGSGVAGNPDFEACKDGKENQGNCELCRYINEPRYNECGRGETVTCETCEGTGVVA